MYIRYRHLRELIGKFDYLETQQRINYLTLIIGYLACIGCSIVGNFQELHVLVIHWVGAGLTFGMGSVYMILQVLLNGLSYYE